MAVLRMLLSALLLLAGGPLARIAAATAPPAPQDAASGSVADGGTGLITIDHEIDDSQDAYLHRALAEAKERHCSQILLHFRTDGGTFGAGRNMLGQLLELTGPQHPPLIAYVDDHCYSAGAMIAYGCDKIYLSSHAMIGDIGVIFIKSDGTMEYAPEKMQTVARSLLRSAAQTRGWDAAKLQKMTALNQNLYRFELGKGKAVKVQYVLEDDLNSFLHDHPEIDAKDLDKDIATGKDRLLTYTGLDAINNGMATGLADNLAALEQQLHIDPRRIIDLQPSSVERTAWSLAGFAPLLAALAVLCVFLEFKFGGSGIFIVLAAICGGSFLVCQYYQEMASYPEAVLMLLGAILIGLELFVFPTAGWLLITGMMLGCIGLILAFMPDTIKFNPGSQEWAGDFTHALLRGGLALLVMFVGVIALIIGLPNSPLIRRVSVRSGETGTPVVEAAARQLVGRRGTARTDLAPLGKILIDGEDLTACAENSAFLQAGTQVEVVDIRFGEAVVRRITGTPA